MAAKIKKGDKVVVLAGRDKGRKGEVKMVMPKEGKALVSGVNLVVRPHPGEKPSTWEQILAAIPNGRLIARSDPHPWILGAKLLVHSGCTTGLEAVLLGTPAIDIMPTDHPTCDRIVSYANPRYRKPEDAAQAITAFLQRREGFPAGQATAALETHLPSYRDDTAAKIMAQGLAAELAKHDAPPRKGFELTWRAPFTEYQRSAAERDKYAATVDEIREGLRKAAVVAGASGEVRVETIGEGLFLATPR